MGAGRSADFAGYGTNILEDRGRRDSRFLNHHPPDDFPGELPITARLPVPTPRFPRPGSFRLLLDFRQTAGAGPVSPTCSGFLQLAVIEFPGTGHERFVYDRCGNLQLGLACRRLQFELHIDEFLNGFVGEFNGLNENFLGELIGASFRP